MKQGDKVRLIRVVCVLTQEDELGTPRILGDVLQLPCSRRRHGKCRGVRPGTCAHEDELELIELKPCPAPTEDKPPQSGIERTDAMRWVEYVIVTKTTTDEDGKVVPEKPVVPADDKGPLPRVWTDLSGQDFTDLVGDLNREAIMGAGGTPKVQVIAGPFGQN